MAKHFHAAVSSRYGRNELHLNILFLFWYFIHFSANKSIWFFFLSLFPHRKWFYMLEIILMMHIWSHVSSVCFKSIKPHIFDLWELSTAPGETPTQAQRELPNFTKKCPSRATSKQQLCCLYFRYYSNPFTCTLYMFTSKLIKFAFLTSSFSVILNDKVKK